MSLRLNAPLRRPLMTLVALTLALGMFAMMAGSASAAPKPRADVGAVPVTGTSGTSSFAGIYTVQRFINQDGALAAVGTVTGTLTDTATGATTPVAQQVTAPVTQAVDPPACDILHLTLGPLHLDLLGLVIDLNQVVLNITAVPGPGNLLGNLLCSVAGLLDGPGLNGLVTRLNHLLGL